MSEDAIDRAVAAAAAADLDSPPDRGRVDVTIGSTKREVSIEFPLDMTDGEIAEFVGWMGTTLLGACRAERKLRETPAAPTIEIARAMPQGAPPAPTRK